MSEKPNKQVPAKELGSRAALACTWDDRQPVEVFISKPTESPEIGPIEPMDPPAPTLTSCSDFDSAPFVEVKPVSRSKESISEVVSTPSPEELRGPWRRATKKPSDPDGVGRYRTLSDIVRLIPDLDDAGIEALERFILQAREKPPSDKAAFVRDVNRALDVFELRILADGKDLCRLILSRASSIQLTLSGRGVRSFKSAASIELIRVPHNYRGNRWDSRLSAHISRD